MAQSGHDCEELLNGGLNHNTNKETKSPFQNVYFTGADPGFLKRWFKCRKGGFVCLISHKFLEIPHQNGIIWVQRGVRTNL